MVGLDIHKEPFVYHFGKRGTDMILVPGMIFTIEPMIHVSEDNTCGIVVEIEKKDIFMI